MVFIGNKANLNTVIHNSANEPKVQINRILWKVLHIIVSDVGTKIEIHRIYTDKGNNLVALRN